MVHLQRKPLKPRISVITCSGEGNALLQWKPALDVVFYEVHHLREDSQTWQSVDVVTNGSSSKYTLGHCSVNTCSVCKFKLTAHNGAGCATSEVIQCTRPFEHEDVRLLVSGITIRREENVFHITWTDTKSENICLRLCSHPSEMCHETCETRTSFGMDHTHPENFLPISHCNATGNSRRRPVVPLLRTFYNCDLTLEITEVQHVRTDSVDVFWTFHSDRACSLRGRLVVDGSTTYEVDLNQQRFRSENVGHFRVNCLKLKAFHGDRELQGSSQHRSCLVRGQG